jgi:hypothetical protein
MPTGIPIPRTVVSAIGLLRERQAASPQIGGNMKTNLKMLGLASCVALCAATTSAYAFDIRQLNNSDVNSAVMVLRSQGYRQVGTKYDDGKLWILYFNRDTHECAGYVDRRGRVKKARTFENHVCRDNRDRGYGHHSRDHRDHRDRDDY